MKDLLKELFQFRNDSIPLIGLKIFTVFVAILVIGFIILDLIQNS